MIITRMTMSIYVCLVLMSGLLIVYFSKEREDTPENKYFTAMIITNFIGLIIHVLAEYAAFYYIPILSTIILKCVLYYYLIFSFLFINYLLVILKLKWTKIYINIFRVICIGSCILVTFLEEKLYVEDLVSYTYGPDTKVVFVLGFLCFFIILLLFIFKNKYLNRRNKMYVLSFLVGLFVATSIHNNFPEMQISILVESAVCFMMYFTIENPDVDKKVYNAAKNQAIKAGRVKEDFLSSMSHELRTPLNAIVGLSQMIEAESNQEEIKSDAKDIVIASQDLLELVSSILNANSIENNTLDLELGEYDLNEINDHLTKMIEIRLRDRDVKLETNFSKEIPTKLYGDSDKIKTIITNLLSNAIKYTNSGTINFNVSCTNKNDICKLEIIVKDTGRGMSKEQLNNLFTNFNRREEDKDSDIKGVGLGLAITKSLVDLMEGTINVESEENVGTTFTVRLNQKIIEHNNIEVL